MWMCGCFGVGEEGSGGELGDVPSESKNQAPRYLNVFRSRFISVGWSIPPNLLQAATISRLMYHPPSPSSEVEDVLRVIEEEEVEGR